MKSPNRLLLGIGVAIVALAAIAVALVLFTQNNVSLLSPDTPEGTVQRFLIAVQDKDYRQAYSYLQITEKDVKVPYAEWVRDVPIFISPPSQTAWKATLGKTTVSGNNAGVEVLIDTFRPGGPFENSTYTQQVYFQLTKIGDSWLITTRPPLYWFY